MRAAGGVTFQSGRYPSIRAIWLLSLLCLFLRSFAALFLLLALAQAGQPERDHESAARPIRERNAAAVRLNHFPTHGKPQARAWGLPCVGKWLKRRRLEFARETAPAADSWSRSGCPACAAPGVGREL